MTVDAISASICSKVAQWWSTRLLTDRLWVRAPPLEPIFFRKISSANNIAGWSSW